MFETLSDTVRSTIRSVRRPEIESLIRHYSFPWGLRKKIADRLGLTNEKSIERVLFALKEYFLLCFDGRGMMLGMPSKAVDTAWHEFILYTRDYSYFCRRTFGEYLHHTPDDGAGAGDDFLVGPGRSTMDLGRTWILCCMRSGQDPRRPTEVPLLLSIDAELGIADGHTLADLAALPIPPGFIETEPGRYRYIARKNRKKQNSRSWWAPDHAGSSSGGSCGGGTACSGGGHHGGGHGGGCSGSGGCGGGGGGGCGGGGGH